MKEILFYREGKADYPSFFSDKLICKWIEVIAGHYNKSVGAINFIFCDDDYILAVNRQYLKHDYYTDVITFDYCEGDVLSGDVFISLDTVKSNSEMFSTFFENASFLNNIPVLPSSLSHSIEFQYKSHAPVATA